MEWTGAGLLPLANDCFLLAQARNGEWSELGGLRKPEEPPSIAATREVWELSRHALGSFPYIRSRIKESIERVSYGNFRTFICRWPASEMEAVLKQFHSAENSCSRRDEVRALAWIKTADIYRAIAQSKPVEPRKVWVGKHHLSSRLVYTISKSASFTRFLARHPELNSFAQGDEIALGICSGLRAGRGKNENLALGVIPLVILSNGKSKPGKVFAVIKRGRSPEELVVRDRSYLNPNYEPGLIQSIFQSFLWILRRPPSGASQQERLAIWHALQQENMLSSLSRRILDMRSRHAWLSQAAVERLKRPVQESE